MGPAHVKPVIGVLMARVKALNRSAIMGSEDASESSTRTMGSTRRESRPGAELMCVCDVMN